MSQSDRESALKAAKEIAYPFSTLGVLAIPLDDAVDLILARERAAEIKALKWALDSAKEAYWAKKINAEIARLESLADNKGTECTSTNENR